MFAQVQPRVFQALGGVAGILVLASVVVFALQRLRPGSNFSELKNRIKSWWIMATVFALAMTLSRNVSILLFSFLSFLALKEYFSLVPVRRADRRPLFWAYLAIPLQYLWCYHAWYGMFIIFIPVYMFLLIPLRMALIGETEGFLRSAGTIQCGLMTMVFSLSHLAQLLVLPASGNPVAGGPGLVLFVVFLTELNDVAQFLWGKSFGGAKIIPRVSPNKTWAGFLGGVVTTIALAYVLAPYLTPLSHLESLSAGILIGVMG